MSTKSELTRRTLLAGIGLAAAGAAIALDSGRTSDAGDRPRCAPPDA